ncbi:PucR family transcriptional regulator [Leucobacter sp. CSA2]|uniref:PucR family transcriptional regulator n=1 Tax=Leucobacter edaphi TaxID=2796472 RepID=A0A934QBH1_9MICO|nr:PucR family transcriptional regulator [Leucobacter edaphi]MBK0421541.1 PucR family transcriptional regulator [Leucobacter edaphi]
MVPQQPVRDRASVPLATLLDEPTFAASLLSPAPEALADDPALAERIRNAPVASTIVIELDDPGAYMTPGDLLLITGLAITGDAAADAAYAQRLHAAGVSALVFGLEPVHARVPESLVRACRDLDFPLVVLPPPIYFAAVTSHLNRALETERTRALEAMNTVARRLTEATMQHRPAQRLVDELAREGTGWAMLRMDDEVYLGGTVPEGVDLDALTGDLRDRLHAPGGTRRAGQPAFTTVAVPDPGAAAGAGGSGSPHSGDYAGGGAISGGVEHEVAAVETTPHRGRARGGSAILALGRSPRLTRTDLTALQLAANLVGLILQLPAAQSMAVDQLLMHFMIETSGTRIAGADRDRFARLVANSLGGAKHAHAVVAIRDPGRQIGSDPVADGGTVASDAVWLRRLLHTPFVEHRAKRLRAFTAGPPRPSELALARELGWLLAVSSAHDFGELPAAMREAEELARAAAHLGHHIDGVAAPAEAAWPLGAAADPVVARAAAAHWLAPLSGPDQEEVREVLTAWLRAHGSWDRAARDLDLHRNTVRRRVAEARALLGRDLDDPLERARILLALTALQSDA